MATQLGVSQKTYSNIENAGSNIPYTKIERIAEILGVNVMKILELDTEFLLSNGQPGGTNQLPLPTSYKYFYEEQAKLYERLLNEKDNVINILSNK